MNPVRCVLLMSYGYVVKPASKLSNSNSPLVTRGWRDQNLADTTVREAGQKCSCRDIGEYGQGVLIPNPWPSRLHSTRHAITLQGDQIAVMLKTRA
jgi:hypothetical protein